MITSTSLVHASMIKKIEDAIMDARDTGINQYVTNRNGRPILRVGVDRGMITYYAGNRNMFPVVKKARDIYRSRKTGG